MTYHDNRLEAASSAAGLALNDDRPARRYVRKFSAFEYDRPPKVPDPLPPVWAPGATAKLLLDLELGDCRFPVGEASGVDQLFCGDDAHHQPAGYCPTCARRVLAKDADVNPAVAS